MSRIETIQTEYISGSVFGSSNDHRCIIRTPTHMVTSCYGIAVFIRNNKYASLLAPAGRSLKTADLSVIEKHLGQVGLDAWNAALNRRGFGTAIVDGGGKFPTPSRERMNQIKEAFYYSEHASFSVTPCRQCGMEIPKRERVVEPDGIDTRTMAEIQRRSNLCITKVNYEFARVLTYHTWDGTLVDDHFCTDACARRYGKRAATSLDPLPVEKPCTTR